MKWTTKKFTDHVTFSVCLLFNKYYSQLYINVNQIITDCDFYIHSRRSESCDANMKNLTILNLLIQSFPSRQKFLVSAELQQTNNY